ncbi:MAG TPA: hypothetical protein VGI24_04865 [Solirubrobacteraceae bacterium]
MRRIPAVVFAGDARVWRVVAIAAIPLVALVAFYCLRPREYYTGTNSVEAYTYIAEVGPGEPVCVPGLEIPSGTARIRLQLISRTRVRPALSMTLRVGATTELRAFLSPVKVPPHRVSAAVFTLPGLSSQAHEHLASLCVTASGLVNWGGTPLPAPPATATPSAGGSPVSGRIAVWYLPPAGAERSYLSRAGAILRRASLFRPSPVGPWLYVLIFLILLPGLAFAAVRCLAVAVGRGRSTSARRTAAWLFVIAALNFACWALITPPFQAPDEVDHFAYTQSLVERGQAPSQSPASPLARWSSAETLALEDESFFDDHQVGDTRAPWTARSQTVYRKQVAATHPSSSNGGGNETAATHGAIYYAALAPAYWLASSSPFSQLTLMRLTSALIGALTVVFAFLLARELAPGRPWLGVLAALLVCYEPMYGFISGAVNNDVGVNAGAAALELLIILMLRRGVKLWLGLLTGALLIVMPIVKETVYALYPVFALALVATLYRHHRRVDLRGWVALVLAALAARGLSLRLAHVFHPLAAAGTGPVGAPSEAGSVGASTREALAHPIDYLSYLWQSLLPRLPFMTNHFPNHFPAMVIFVERGWGAFGWYDVFFPHRVYEVILAAMIAVPILGLIALWREWSFVRRNAVEFVLLALMALAVVAGFEAAFYTPGVRPFIAEFGRYAFPAIAPLAVLVVASLHAFGRRWVLPAGVGLLVAIVALSYAGQLVTLTGFYA